MKSHKIKLTLSKMVIVCTLFLQIFTTNLFSKEKKTRIIGGSNVSSEKEFKKHLKIA